MAREGQCFLLLLGMLKSAQFATLLTIIARVAAEAIETADLANFLINASSTLYPPIRSVSEHIYRSPEISDDEFFAHNALTGYFQARGKLRLSHSPFKFGSGCSHYLASEGWKVTKHAYNEPTGFEVTYEHRPTNYSGALPVIGFLAEYDALLAVHHACGHHLIALNGVLSAALTRQAVVHVRRG